MLEQRWEGGGEGGGERVRGEGRGARSRRSRPPPDARMQAVSRRSVATHVAQVEPVREDRVRDKRKSLLSVFQPPIHTAVHAADTRAR